MPKQSIQKSLQSKTFFPYVIAVAILAAVVLLGVSIGTVSVPIFDSFHIITRSIFRMPMPASIDPMHENIVLNIRLPRVILAGLVGAALAISGAAFQGLLRNPLADPYTLGISSGASVGAVMTIFFQLHFPLLGLFALPLFSMIAAFLTMVMVLFFARILDESMRVETLILTGIIFSSFLGALISLMIALTGKELRQIIGWLLGSVSMRGWEYVFLILPFLLIGFFLLLFQARALNAMSLGEERAQHLGVDVEKRKKIVLIAASILTGAAVAVSGTIGFVGLVIPHLTRMLWGPTHQHLLPLSFLTGSSFLILADLASRTIIAPTELPIGVITALIGAPIFAGIMLKRRTERRG